MTKKLLSILLAVLMVLTFVTPAMAEDPPAGTAVARLESTGAEYETLQAAIDAAKAAIDDENGDHSAQTVTLLADVTESVTMYWVRPLKCNWNFDLTIDLNGKTVNGGGERAFYFADTSNAAAKQTCTIRIKDSVGTGKVTGGVADNGGAIYLKGKSTTTVIVDGGTFTGNTATSSGGAIWANIASGGKVVINGGVFTKNTAPSGGAITALNLTINGGVFTENSATGTAQFTGRGGAICVWGTPAYLTVNGGKIYNNTAALNGDDIVFQIKANRTGEMKLISAADMGVNASGWFLDEVGRRYSEDNAVEFTEYASYKTKGVAVSLKAVINPEYTVKYVDGASGEAFEAEEYTVKAGEATPAFQGDLTKYPGWKFKAWTPDLADTVTEDVTYTATWEPKGANTIIYWGNGGTRSKYSVGDTFWSEYTSAAEIKVRGNGFLSFALDEYAFNGWNTKADGTGDGYKSGDMYKFTAAHDLDKANLYAQWKLIAFNVSFNSNGGNTLDPIKVTLNKPYGTLPSAGSINGLQNLGWYLVDEQGNVTDTAVNAKTVVTLERDHTLFQKREIKTPTVKISLSRPVYNYLDKPVSLNASLTEYPALKYSYQWYKDGVALANDDLYDGVNTKSLTLKHDYVSASGVYKLVVTVTLADGSDIVVTNSPVTAEASYTLNIRRTSNMLYYDANGGEGGPSNNSDYYDKANDRYVAKVQSSQPTRSEWKFIGWNTKADGSGDSYKAGDFYVFDRQLSENGGLKAWLYAQWDHLTCAENLEDVKVITEPTCTEKGLKLCRCTVCGDEYEVEIPALGHDHGGRWTWNREEHWKKCLRCGAIIDCEEHTYGDWKPVVDNKGKDTDREERSCTVCGFTQYAQTIHIGGSTVTKPTDEQNPNTGAQVPSLLPALAVLAGAAVVLRKRK